MNIISLCIIYLVNNELLIIPSVKYDLTDTYVNYKLSVSSIQYNNTMDSIII